MSGYPIIFRAIDLHYVEPTRIYACVDRGGRWELQLEVELREATIDCIANYLKEEAVAGHKPIVIPDGLPNMREALRARGIRVR